MKISKILYQDQVNLGLVSRQNDEIIYSYNELMRVNEILKFPENDCNAT